MRTFLLFVFLLGLVAAGADPLEKNEYLAEGGADQRTTNTWDGSSGTDWYTGANWSLGHVPATTEDVVIPQVTNNNFPVLAGLATINSLTINSGTRTTLAVTTGTLTVQNYFNCYGNLTMTSSSGSITVKGNLTFGSGATTTFTANVTVNVWADLNFQSGSAVGMNNGTINLAGGITYSYFSVNQSGATVHNLSVNKVSPYAAIISPSSTYPLTINGALTVNSAFAHDYAGTTILKGDLNVGSGASFGLNAGTISLEGSYNALINTPNTGHYFNHLTINKASGYSATLLSDIWVKGNLSIQSGTFSAVYTSVSHNIKLGGNWSNTTGPAAFTEGYGSVTLNGTGVQYLSTENFATLILNKSAGWMSILAGTAVQCASYDWVAGSYEVQGGSFTTLDLVDPGICGTILLNGGTINYSQDSAAGSYVDLRGSLSIYNGSFTVSGGNGPSYFGRGTAAMLYLASSGVLDFQSVGIIIANGYSFTENIVGGTIRTAERFICDRYDFTPSGGTVEMYGSASCEFRTASGSHLRNLTLNKASAAVVSAIGPIQINGTLKLESGTFSLASSVALTCASYDWAGGGYILNGGTFTANDLADPGIYGSITLNSGTINYFQDNDPSSYMDLCGNLTIRGGTFNLYGGYPDAWLPGSPDAVLDMSAGTLNFASQGIVVNSASPIGSQITGGTIRTTGRFEVTEADFAPAGGLVELYGDASSYLYMEEGSSFYELKVNKSSSSATVGVNGHLATRGNFYLHGGTFNAPPSMTVGGNWYKLDGTVFNPGTGSVYFNGTGIQTVGGNNTFLHVIDANTHSLFLDSTNAISGFLIVSNNVTAMGACTINQAVVANPAASLCFANNHSSVISSYEGWGTLKCLGPGTSVTISDLAQNGLYGSFIADGGHLEIHQDSASHCEVNGDITILNSGIMDIFGADTHVYLALNGNVNFTMDTGYFIIRDQGLRISASAYSCNFNISGGTIGCAGTWYDERGTFDPSAGVVMLTGPQDCAIITHIDSWFHQLRIDKPFTRSSEDPDAAANPGQRSGNVSINSCTVRGGFLIDDANVVTLWGALNCVNGGDVAIYAGVLELGHQSMYTSGDIHVSGTLKVDSGATLHIAHGKALNVYYGGALEVVGEIGNPATITHNQIGFYALNIENGAVIAPYGAIFEYMDEQGVNVKPGALVDDWYKFDHCVFRFGASDGTLLTLGNNQSLNIVGASFPSIASGWPRNVHKSADQGFIVFHDYSGGFSGSLYENDPYNRIEWDGETLPPVQDLSIVYLPAENLIHLQWTYPQTVDRFRVWRCATPDGVFEDMGYSTGDVWFETPAGNRYFYRVTAERD